MGGTHRGDVSRSLVEIGPAREVVGHPQHPYTQVLLSAIPEADPDATRAKKRIELRSTGYAQPVATAIGLRVPSPLPGLCRRGVRKSRATAEESRLGQ